MELPTSSAKVQKGRTLEKKLQILGCHVYHKNRARVSKNTRRADTQSSEVGACTVSQVRDACIRTWKLEKESCGRLASTTATSARIAKERCLNLRQGIGARTGLREPLRKQGARR